MTYKIEILKSPRSDAETIAGAEALLQLKGVVPTQSKRPI